MFERIFIQTLQIILLCVVIIMIIDKGKIVNQGTFEELRSINADFNNQANFMGI